MNEPARLLLIGDHDADLELCARLLAAEPTLICAQAPDAMAFAEALADPPELAVILSPLNWTTAERVIATLQKLSPVPVVLLAGPATTSAARQNANQVLPRAATGFLALAEAARRVLESSIPSEDHLLQSALEHAEVAVFRTNERGHLQSGNRRFLELASDPAVGSDVLSRWVPADQRADLVARLRDDGFHHLSANGVAVTLAAQPDRHGLSIVGVIGEPTAAPRTGAVARKAMLAAHDLKEPLRTIARYAELLCGRYASDIDADGRDMLDILHDAAVRAQSRVSELFTAPQRAQTPAEHLAACDAHEVLDEVFQNLAAAVDQNAATITADALPSLCVKRQELTALMQNLVENALKFRGEEPPVIHISAVRSASDWLFSVSDNGVGVASEDTERIFEMFHRGNAPDRTAGTGIGLAVCKGIVDRHGGRIWCESSVGTTFYFTLPAMRLVPPEPDRTRDTAIEVPNAHALLDEDASSTG